MLTIKDNTNRVTRSRDRHDDEELRMILVVVVVVVLVALMRSTD
jgi:hypothetical protein